MGLIRRISLDAINGPSDLARVLRWLLEDNLDARQFEIENPIFSKANDNDPRSYLFRGREDEVAFVLVADSGSPVLKVTVSDEESLDAPVAPPVNVAAAPPALSEKEQRVLSLMRSNRPFVDDIVVTLEAFLRSGLNGASATLRFGAANPLHDDEATVLNAWHDSSLSVNEAIARMHDLLDPDRDDETPMDLGGGLTDDERYIVAIFRGLDIDRKTAARQMMGLDSGMSAADAALVAAFHALDITLAMALRRLENESEEVMVSPSVKAAGQCCEPGKGCRFGLKRLLGLT